MSAPERRWHITRFGVQLCALANENDDVCMVRHYDRHGTMGRAIAVSRSAVFRTLVEEIGRAHV